MAGSRRKDDSAILHKGRRVLKKRVNNRHIRETNKLVNFNDEKHRRKTKWRKIKFIILIIVLILIEIIPIFLIYRYAGENECLSAFYGFIRSASIEFAAGIIIDFIVTVITYNKNNKLLLTLILGIGVEVIIYIVLLIGLFSAVKEEMYIKKEDTEYVQSKAMEIISNIYSTGELKIRKKEYSILKDPYMEQSLEEYCGVIDTIDDDDVISKKAEVLMENIDNNTPKGKQSEDYDNHTDDANRRHDTYIFQKKRDEAVDRDSLFEDRIYSLDSSIASRIKADDGFQNPENERLIGGAYKEKGDEYAKKKQEEEAFKSYDEGAKWYMQACCYAVANGDMEEAKTALKEFEKLKKEVDSLQSTDDDKKSKIVEMYDVYDLFLQLI